MVSSPVKNGIKSGRRLMIDSLIGYRMYLHFAWFSIENHAKCEELRIDFRIPICRLIQDV